MLGTSDLIEKTWQVHEILKIFITNHAVKVLDQLDFELEDIHGQHSIAYIMSLPRGGKRLGQSPCGHDRTHKRQHCRKYAQKVMNIMSTFLKFLLRAVSESMGVEDIVDGILKLDLPWFWYFEEDHDNQKQVEIALKLAEGALATYFSCLTKCLCKKLFMMPDNEINCFQFARKSPMIRTTQGSRADARSTPYVRLADMIFLRSISRPFSKRATYVRTVSKPRGML